MLTAIAILLFLVLAGIAGLHAYWALGGLWPCDDEASLVRTVVGTEHRSVMPPVWLTLLVAALIFAAALVPLSVTPVLAGALPATLAYSGLAVLAAIFVVRGCWLSRRPFADATAPNPSRLSTAAFTVPLLGYRCRIPGVARSRLARFQLKTGLLPDIDW